MSEGNGHDPAVTDLGAVLERTRTMRELRIPISALTGDSLTPYELVAVGRALNMTPADISESVAQAGGDWSSVELMQAIAWAIARREEPDLTWEEAQRFRVIPVGEPPNPQRPRSRRRGASSS